MIQCAEAPRSGKMDCSSYELLQWFVDEVLFLMCRGDSALLLNRARELRDALKASGGP